MRKIQSSLLLLIVLIPVFVLPVFGMDQRSYWIFVLVVSGASILSYLRDRQLFPTILFFSLVHALRPVNHWFSELVRLEFPGTFFLIPILVFTILILLFPGIRSTISWWTRDTIDRTTIWVIAGMSLISGAALLIWGLFIAADLTEFTENLPEVSLIWILLNGLGFAFFNSIAEEYLSRGMLCNGLEKIFANKQLIIVIQACLFGIFHYCGFPGGFIGVGMVILWSLVLGWIRYRSKGLMGVIIGHFFADLTIYFILYAIK